MPVIRFKRRMRRLEVTKCQTLCVLYNELPPDSAHLDETALDAMAGDRMLKLYHLS